MTSRLVLPAWISKPIERAVARWVDEHQTWQERIQKRHMEGKELTAAVKRQYDMWCSERCEEHFLFSRVTCSLAPAPRKNANMERLKREMFSLVVHMSINPQDLLIQAGNGDARRLVVLQGKAKMCEDELALGFLDQGLEENALEHLEKASEDKEDQEEDDGDENGEDHGFLDEENALVEQEGMISNAHAEASDLEEVLAFSSEEEGLADMVDRPFVRVKSFQRREAYKSLEARGLMLLPQGGVHISYHKSTRAWTGFYRGQKAEGLCYTHGGKTKRTEGECLLKVIKGILEAHVAQFPRDRLWKAQLEKVKNAEATIAKL